MTAQSLEKNYLKIGNIVSIAVHILRFAIVSSIYFFNCLNCLVDCLPLGLNNRDDIGLLMFSSICFINYQLSSLDASEITS
jgi:hypothetical protein